MTDVNLTWVNPASSLGVKEIKIFKISGDYTQKNHSVFIEDSSLLAAIPMTAPNVSQTYVDQDVVPGTFTYGVFSSNNLGLGPGDLCDTAVVVIPPLAIGVKTGYIDYSSLSWGITYEGDLEEYSSFTYELSTSETEFDANIVETETVATIKNNILYSGLTGQQSYYFRVKAQGVFTVYSEISGSHTDPCSEFTATRTEDGVGGFTLTVTTNVANEAVFVSEDLNDSDIRGLVRPIADDEFGNLWLAVGESRAYDPDTGDTGGRLVFDTGFLKFTSDRTVWKSAWAGNLYASNVPGHISYLANSIKYTRRISSPQNNIMYFSDDSQLGQFKYPISRFTANFSGVVETLGSTFTYFKDQTADGSHYNWLQANDSNETAASYLEYFNQFDTIIYTATDILDGRSPWLSENFIEGFLNYVDGGGGAIFITDHDSFQGVVNPIVANFGIQFTSSVDRNAGNPAYQVSNILSNSLNLPGGFHPLFENISPTASISAVDSEGILVYYDTVTGLTSTENPNPTARTSKYSSGDSKSVTITTHTDSDNTPIGGSKLIIRTASGCGEIIEPTSSSQDLVVEPPSEPMYTLVSFSDGTFSDMYGSPDGRWYPKDVDDKALYLGEDAPYKYYAFPLSPEGQRFTIVPETQASYFSDVSRGAGVGTNLWEWYWYKYTPALGPYQVIGSAANYVKYDSSTPNLNIGTPKFSLWLAYPNVLLRDLQYNPYNRFTESEVLAIKASLEAGNGTGSPVGSAMRLSVNYNEEFRTHDSQYPPTPY
jgi:hypothetical protein